MINFVKLSLLIIIQLALFILVMPILHASDNVNAAACGSLQPDNNYGPWDYTNPVHYQEKLPVVTRGHFPSYVENLERGRTGPLSSDLWYVLKTFPNHHRALWSMARYQLREGGRAGMPYTAECFFERALRLKPDDGVVMMIKAMYFHKKKEYSNALDSYEQAIQFLPESAELHYNKGLVHYELGQYDKAEHHADQAYTKGYPLPGLRKKLAKVK